MFTFVPEYYFDTFDKASVDFLLSIGVRGIILDIDNTLEPYEHPRAGKRVLDWLQSLRSAGIKAAIVSNNNEDRVKTFNSDLDLPAFSKAGKPFKKNVERAINAMGIDKSEAILMGDQVFTDVWAAHNAGIKAILVPPIKDRRDILTVFKRFLEIPILKSYKNREAKK